MALEMVDIEMSELPVAVDLRAGRSELRRFWELINHCLVDSRRPGLFRLEGLPRLKGQTKLRELAFIYDSDVLNAF